MDDNTHPEPGKEYRGGLITVLLIILGFLALSLLGGCKHTPEAEDPPYQGEVVRAFECGEPPGSDPFKARAVTWGVQALADGTKVFSLSAPMYEALMANWIDALASAKQVAAQRDFYADCIRRSQPVAAPDKPPEP